MFKLAVWIECLACYNAGDLVDRRVYAYVVNDIAPKDLHDRPTSHEGLWCFDLKGFLRGVVAMSPSDVALWIELFTEVRESLSLWEHLLARAGNGVHVEGADGLPDFFSSKDRCRGCWPSFRDNLAEEVEPLSRAGLTRQLDTSMRPPTSMMRDLTTRCSRLQAVRCLSSSICEDIQPSGMG